MSENTSNANAAGEAQSAKLELVKRLANADAEFFVMMSACTKAPYIVCDPETFDDEVLLFFTEEDARKGCKEQMDAGNPVNAAKLGSKQMLLFFTSLYTMGVNALLIHWNGEKTVAQLSDIVKRRNQEDMPEGSVWVENPALHLTALYFAQTLRSPVKPDTQERLAELQEELNADFRRGRFIFGLGKEEQGTPLVKLKDGNVYQPVFTDILEFQRFNKENKFRPVVVEGEKFSQVLAKEAKGVILNIMSVSLPLMVSRPQMPGQTGAVSAPDGSTADLS